jgi:arylsulfatase A-like enzyme
MLASLVLALSLSGEHAAPAAAAGETPNVVVIMTDDQTAESMRVMQQTRALLGDEGVTFANSFVNLPLCCPSRATFLTGLYAHNHHVTTNAWPNGGFYKFEGSFGDANLATALQGAGYHTVLVGKHLNEYGAREPDPALVPPGWSEWYATLEPNPDTYDYRLNENGATVTYGDAPGDYKTDVLTAKALDVIDRQAAGAQPLFLWLSYTAPHGGGPDPSPQPPFDCDPGTQPAPRHATAFDTEPLPRPPNFNEADVSDKPPSIQNSPLLDAAQIQTLEGRYRCALEALLAVDEGVSSVTAALEAQGQLDNTLIIFTSDNGFYNGEHRDAEGKGTHYDPATRVPLLIRGPGVPAGVTSDELVVNADLAPTILDAAGVVPAVAPDGLSLLSLFDPGLGWKRDEVLLENRSYAGVHDERYVYVEHDSGEDAGSIELYDLSTDPYELENVHGDPAYTEVEEALATRLAALRDCAGATCSPAPEAITDVPVTQPTQPPSDPGPVDPGPPGASDTDPPDTTITKRPPKRTSKHKLVFEFSSDEAGATYECRRDKAPFVSCSSPTKIRAGAGRHRFQVRSIDAAGNLDPTPDEAVFRVRRRH